MAQGPDRIPRIHHLRQRRRGDGRIRPNPAGDQAGRIPKGGTTLPGGCEFLPKVHQGLQQNHPAPDELVGFFWHKVQKGIYVDRHERPDVRYRQEVFLPAFDDIRPFLVTWDEEGRVIMPQIFLLVKSLWSLLLKYQ